MVVDNVTLKDLSLFEGSPSLFALVNKCVTQEGAHWLNEQIKRPPGTYEALKERQDMVRFFLGQLHHWPDRVTNGTLVMARKFFETEPEGREAPLNIWLHSLFHKVFNKDAHSFVRFSVAHIRDLLWGCQQLCRLGNDASLVLPAAIQAELTLMDAILDLDLSKALLALPAKAPYVQLVALGHRLRRNFKKQVYDLMGAFTRLDAVHAMALATEELGWTLPELRPASSLRFDADGLYHPLLKDPVAYDIHMGGRQNFLFLTGANMSGKSTFIRTLGLSALLAHIGMGVPARKMEISFLSGIVTNMQVEDNLFKGESYFLAEVQRMKATAQKLKDDGHYMVLMDELFKGTNVHDAYDCSLAVIKGLLSRRNNLMALSTHLSELKESLRDREEVLFRYFYTEVTEQGGYSFTYQMKEGVSEDRIGFWVLKNEGVLDLLNGR